MAVRTLIWSPEAQEDLDEILAFYRERNGNSEYSDRLSEEIRKALERVVSNPKYGPRWIKRGFRSVNVKPFQVFYRVTKNEIRVSRVWDARRNPDTLKLTR